MHDYTGVMIRGAALALVVAAAQPGSLGTPAARAENTAWPGAVEAEGGALDGRPEGERLDPVARFVSRFGAATAAPWLRPLLRPGPAAVRLFAARALVRIGDAGARAAALDWLVGPASSPSDRSLGLDALSWGPPAPEVRAAVEQAARDRDALTRAEALDALGRLDGADANQGSASLPVILGCLDDLDREVRVRAVRLVTRAAEIDPGAASPAAPMLLERLDDSDRLVRATALRALAALRDPRTVPALLRLAAADDPTGLQTAAVDALGWPGATAAVPFLVTRLRHRPADETARHAARALGAIASPPAVAALVAALRLPPVPEEVAEALVEAGPAATAPLLGLLDGPELGSAARAIPVLARIGDRRAVAPLGRAVRRQGGNGPLALVAIGALAQMRESGGVPALAEAAEAPDPEVRRAALTALASLADLRAAASVERALADGDAGVRAAGALLAGRLGASDAAPGLVERLGDESPAVGAAAARALAGLEPGALRGRHLLGRALDALARSPAGARDDAEVIAIGGALEALATESDAGRLDAAAIAGGDMRMLGPALAAAHQRAPLADRALVARLLSEVGADSERALAAAGALAVARLGDDDQAPLAQAAQQAEPAVRARLCEAIARLPEGGAWLQAWMSPREPAEVRAAAAWAARRRPELGDTLRALAAGPDEPVATDARAALGAAGTAGQAPYAARLVDPQGTPIAGRWVTFRAGQLSVVLRSDGRGGLLAAGLPEGAVTVSLVD